MVCRHDRGMFYIAPQQGKLASLVVDMSTLQVLENCDEHVARHVRSLVLAGRQRMNATVCSAPTHTMCKNGEDVDVVEDSAEIEITLREGPPSRVSVPARLLELAVFTR